MQELRAARHQEESRSGILCIVGCDQIPTSRPLPRGAPVEGVLGEPDLVDDVPDVTEYPSLVALDDNAQRHDVELVVVEITQGDARNLGENRERFADAPLGFHVAGLPECHAGPGAGSARITRPGSTTGEGQGLRPV